jgi:hypothetical protein
MKNLIVILVLSLSTFCFGQSLSDTINFESFNPYIVNNQVLKSINDERFMYGNLNTWIGAKIFKTIFNLTVDGNYFIKTDNPTKDTATNLYFDEVGIYDNSGDLVIIGKFSTPIELTPGVTLGLELTLDF